MKTILITGASRGIGRATAKELANESDVRVGVLARSRDKLQTLKEEIESHGGICKTLSVDLSSGGAESAIREWIEEELGAIDVLINNAGAIRVRPFMEMREDDFRHIYNVNVWGVAICIRAVISSMDLSKREEPLHIVNISSMGGVSGSVKFPGLSMYSSSKGALNVMTECLAEEYKEENLRINSLALGAAQTEMLEEAFPGFKADMTPKDMAKFISHFSLEGWKYQNGKVVQVATSTP